MLFRGNFSSFLSFYFSSTLRTISLRESEPGIKMPEKTASFPLPPMKFSVQCPADYPYWAQLPSTKWQWLKSNEDWPLQNASMLHFSVEFSAGKNHIIFNPTNVVVPSVNCEKIQSRIALLLHFLSTSLENIESAWKNFLRSSQAALRILNL